jgi:hypothetical protein
VFEGIPGKLRMLTDLRNPLSDVGLEVVSAGGIVLLIRGFSGLPDTSASH